jgi:hypothetical protein
MRPKIHIHSLGDGHTTKVKVMVADKEGVEQEIDISRHVTRVRWGADADAGLARVRIDMVPDGVDLLGELTEVAVFHVKELDEPDAEGDS